MSRHRSPSDRRSHQRPPKRGVALPGAPPRHASAQSALRNGMTAAAMAGGTLALVVPTVAVTSAASGDVSAPGAATLRLAADERRVADASTTVRSTPQAAPLTLPTATDGMLGQASVVPVAQTDEPEPPEVDAAELLKAVGLADVAHKAEEERAARAQCDTGLEGLGLVKPWVRAAAQFLSCRYGEPTLIGVASRSRHSEHPSGLAVDFMMSAERGDQLADCALRNREALGVTYVIWKQRVNYGDGWERMADRGGITANHYDHVHVSFERRAAGETPTIDVCG